MGTINLHLPAAKIVFDSKEHRYFLSDSGKELRGITSQIGRRICPDKYANVDAATLNAAAEYGHSVHEAIELLEISGFTTQVLPEVEAYKAVKREEGLDVVANEYIVTDGEIYASPIDIVAVKDGKILLIDIKTTCTPDKVSTSWQLSIYADFFEKQTGVKVDGVAMLHLRKEKARFIPLQRKSSEDVAALLYATDEEWEARKPETRENGELADIIAKVAAAKLDLSEAEAAAKAAKAVLDELVAELIPEMNALGIEKAENDAIKISVTAASKKRMLDTDKLKELIPTDRSEEFYKMVDVKASARITIKK